MRDMRRRTASALDEVVVTAKSLEDDLPQQLSNTVRASIPSRRRGFRTAATWMLPAHWSLGPGLYISPRNGLRLVQISLRLKNSRCSVLVDGIRINNRLYAGTTPRYAAAGMIERIEVLNGVKRCSTERRRWPARSISSPRLFRPPDGAVSVGYDTNHAQQYNGYYATVSATTISCVRDP